MHVRPGPKFCDEEGYDIHPLNMISLVGPNEPEVNISHLLLDEVSVESVSQTPLVQGLKEMSRKMESVKRIGKSQRRS